MEIKNFIKNNKTKLMIVGTIIGGAVIGGTMLTIIGSKKTVRVTDDVIKGLTKEEVIDYINKFGETNKFGIFKENLMYDIVEL